MDLMSNSSDTSIQAEIIGIFKDLQVDRKILDIVEEFFDFSKDLNLDLLSFEPQHNLYYQNLSTHKAMTLFRKLSVNNFYKYSDRYILFAEALGVKAMFNTIVDCYGFYKAKNDSLFKKRVLHALERRYGEFYANARLMALSEVSYQSSYQSGTLYFDQYLIFEAKVHPRLVYEAGKILMQDGYCHHLMKDKNDVKSVQKLFALVLAYIKPDGQAALKKNEEPTENDLTETEIKEMTYYILNAAKNVMSITEEMHSLVFLFMSMNHSNEVKEHLKYMVRGKNEHYYTFALSAIMEKTPILYFKKHVKDLADLIEVDASKENAVKAVQAGVYAMWKGNAFTPNSTINEIGSNGQELVIYMIENDPEAFVEVMYSTELFYNGGTGYAPKYYFTLFEDLYKMLATFNPQVIKDFDIDYNRDILKLTVEAEKKFTKVAGDEIAAYLSGEKEITVIEPYIDQIADPKNYLDSGTYHTSKIIDALDSNPKFKARYVALKAIQAKHILLQYARNFYNDKESKYGYVKELIKELIDEKVPIDHRFALYENLYEGLWELEDKNEVEKIVFEAMVEHSEDFDESYRNICLNGTVFERKNYVKYLDATNGDDNKNKDAIVAMCKDASKEVRYTVIDVIAKHKEYEKEVIALLEAKKISVRETAVDILGRWGADHYEEILTAAAEKEKSAKLIDKINDMLAMSSAPTNDGETIFVPTQFIETIHKGGRNKKILWLYETPNPEVHFNNGGKADDKYMQAIMLCYSGMTVFGVSENAELLAKELNTEELCRFAAEIYSKWLSAGAESKKKWVINFAAVHGGSNMIEVILRCIKEWSENMRGAIAAEAVKALAMNGTSQALMSIDNIAHKFKHKQVKNAAVQALDSAAEALGITADELGDRIVPNLGFDENMERIFDYGTRKFKVYLTPSLELEVFDENNKKLKNLPAPGKKDTEDIAKASNAEFKQMKKQMKNVISIQKMRLETALLADRRWTVENWKKLFVQNPVMHSFAIGLIWAAYEDDTLVQTFRYMEDGTFNTSEEDEYELSENLTIGLVHPIDLDKEELSIWKEQLSDYEITQPIEQLDRKIYRIKEEEIGKIDLERFRGRSINGMSLMGRALKLGWYKGSPQDAGCFFEFYREDITARIKNDDGTVTLLGNAAELHFEGMYIAGDDSEVQIENVRFYQPGKVQRGSYVYDEVNNEKAISLDKISPRYFSEMINQLETITKTVENN